MTIIGRLEKALVDAGPRGLSRRECSAIAGGWYGMRLRELEARGYLLNYRRGRWGRSWFRVAVVFAPQPESAEIAGEGGELVPLFNVEPAAAEPMSALVGDAA